MSTLESNIDNFPNHEEVYNTGHMGELSVRVTRLGSDQIWTVHTPRLAHKLQNGTLELADIMNTRAVYFGQQPVAASMFQGRAEFGDFTSVYPSYVYSSHDGSLIDNVGGDQNP